MELDLSNKNALVCGASQGIGRAIAMELAGLGCRVAVLARSNDKLESLINDLPNSGIHRALSLDIGDSSALKKQVGALIEEWGALHILVNNTGGPKGGPLAEAEDDSLIEAFRHHVLAASNLLKLALPGMKAAKYGRVINVISTSVKVPIPNLGVSNTIRGAMANWAKTMAEELAPFGVTVNNVLPGFTETPRLVSLIKANAEKRGLDESQVADEWRHNVPAKRFADPAEVAAAAAFLASPAAAYINGINLPVDGGRTGCL